VDDRTGTVTFFAPFDDFTGSPVPATLDAYVDYRQRAIDFIESRNRRIAAYVAKHPPEARPVWASQRFEAVLAHSEAVGQREVLEELLTVGDRLGLYPRPYVESVMFTSPKNRTRMLFTVWPKSDGMHMWLSADAFERFFPQISGDRVRRQLGPDGERDLDQTATRAFIAGLERVLHRTSP
jgi:uncharacterized protein DUF6994